MPVDGTKFDRRALNRRADAHETRMAYTHDPVGNLVGESVTTYTGSSTAVATRGWVYDPFGRLVRTTGLVVEDVPLHATRYRYNGLGMRIMWQDDADADGTLESSERYYIMNDERWRPVATFRDQDEHAKEAFVWHAAGAAGFGGSSYIDSVILRDRDNTACGESCEPWRQEADGTLEERRFYCQNWRADVVAVTKSDGTPIEHVRYSAYGEATVHPVADLNMDGVVTSADLQAWTDLKAGGSSASAFGLDLDFDDYYGPGEGDEDLFWESYDANLGLSGRGRVSTPGVASRIGYAGYQWDQTAGAYHVRYRVYLPEIGRWTRRDPLGYVDGMGLACYCGTSPLIRFDPTGQYGVTCCLAVLFLTEDIAGRTRTDKWKHCYASCVISRACGGFALVSLCGGAKELHDLIFGRFAPPFRKDSWDDMLANASCSHPYVHIPGGVGVLLALRCRSCCDGKYK
jgi:RHS repeat-associated protein